MKRLLCASAAAAALLVGTSSVAAQVFTPTYQSSRLINDIGVYLSSGPGDLTIEGVWRAGPLGLRAGFVDVGDGMLSVGGEFRNPIPIANAPLGLAFTAGGQALVGDGSGVGFQAGLSAGYTFIGEGMAFTPYIHPRIGLVSEIGDDDFGMNVLADVGVDIEFANNMVFRFGAGLGRVGADWGLGLAVRR